MKCVLIETSCPDTRALGVRGLSSYLESRGHACRMIFLPPTVERMSSKASRLTPFSSRLLDSLLEIVREADLIGLSLLSYYYDLGVQLTSFLKEKTGIPVIWGGYHPMGHIRDSLKHADLVCTGEGEHALADYLDRRAEGGSGLDTANLAFISEGHVVQNPVKPLIQDLDGLPFLDYRLDVHIVRDPFKDELVVLDRHRMMMLSRMGPLSKDRQHYHYQSFMSRGCPYQCTYCCESLIHELYRGQKQLRRRSPLSLAGEVSQARESLDFITAIAFSDDSFSEASDEQIEEFAQVYKERICLPFSAQFSPQTISERKLAALIGAGLRYIEVGIQSGSEKTKALYRRKIPNDRLLNTALLLHRHIGKILPPDYHFIVDNPWESRKELMETLELIQEIPRPRGIKTSSLVLYPGTVLYEKAIGEGLIHDEINQVFRKSFGALEANTANLLFYMNDIAWISPGLIRILTRPWFIELDGWFSRIWVRHAISALALMRRVFGKINRILFPGKRLSNL